MSEQLPATITILDGPRRLVAGGRQRLLMLWLMEHPEIVNSPRLEVLEFFCAPTRAGSIDPHWRMQGERLHERTESA